MMWNRYILQGIFSITFIGVLFWASPASANILGNPGFEEPIGGDTTTTWDNTNGATRETNAAVVGLAFTAVPDGTHALLLNATTDFSFQTTQNFQEGDFVVFSALAESDVVDDGTETRGGILRIEFQRRNADRTTTVFQQVTSGRITNLNAPSGGGYVRFTINGTVPAGTAVVSFVLLRLAAGAGNVVFDSIDAEINPVKLTLQASDTSVKPGDLVTIVADLSNNSTQNQNNVELKVDLPAGLNLLTDSVRVNGRTAPFREGSLLIGMRTMRQSDRIRVIFQVLVTPGVALGKVYEVSISALVGGRVSEVRGISLRIRGDPIFDEGTIIGKVFDDRNEDGMQTKGEIGVPRVQIYTEYGVSALTDGDGRFTIPAVRPGRHVLKINGSTLPAGTRFVTEESLLIKTTPGLLNKVRFAVYLPDSALPEEFRKDLQIWVTHGVDLARPELRVSLDSDLIRVGLGRLEREPRFRTKTNYGEFIASWQIEIQDELGEKIWTGVGIGAPPAELPWNGVTDVGELLAPGIYAYRLIVRDSQDHEDWTPLQFFRVIHKSESFDDTAGIPALDVGSFHLFRDGKRTLPLVAKPSIRIYGKTKPDWRVQAGEVPVETGPTGEFEQELFVTPGEKRIVVTAMSPQGELVTVEETLTVKQSSFFLVALGEEELGVNFMDGNLETVARDDSFHEDFYQDGRLSYYLKAKVKGRFLVKSRYDTGDKRNELFTQLDPEEYYPIYGDYSQIDYEGEDTRERLFILVEMDRSFLKWGSYHTDFTDTELGRYNRTLSGLKLHYETLTTTRYGDAKRGFGIFWSKPNHVADHNEFRGTGGSLYYLRNRNLIPGSEKVRIETRDKIQDIPIETRELIYGRDYEIDYRSGRILLREPLSYVSASDTIITNDPFDGNPQYLVVDYEFESARLFEDTTAGFRGFTHFGNHLRIGGTAVEEKRPNLDYDLRAVDATLRLGRNTRVTAEFAQAKFQQVRQGTSFNGGLSFQNQAPVGVRRPREKAYLIKAESKPIEPVDLTGYIQDVEPGFSIDRIKSQEGFRKYGFQARLRLHQHFQLMGRHDSTEVAAQLRPLHLFGVQATIEKVRSTTGQAVFDYGKWNIIGEYLHQHLDLPLRNRINSFFSEKPFYNAFGFRVAHRVTDWLTPYAKTQFTFSGKQNFQLGGGLEAKIGDRTKVYFEEMIGSVGDATRLGIHREQDEKTTSYATIGTQDLGWGERRVVTTVGSSHQLSERSRFYSEREYSTYTGNQPVSFEAGLLGQPLLPGFWSSEIYGYETEFWDRWNWGLRFERRHLEASDFRTFGDLAINDLVRTNTFNTAALRGGYSDPKRITWENSGEVRIDPDAPEVRQWLARELFEWRVHQDLSFLGRLNFGTSRFVEPGALTGRFLEFSTGLAYRPVEWDRLSGLTKYTYLVEVASDAQYQGTDSGTVPTDEEAHIFAIEAGYDLTRYLQAVEKTAYRLSRYETEEIGERFGVGTFLWIHRFNFHVTRKWDLGLEYRMLIQREAADSFRHGPLVEIDREFYDYVRLGIGYNFTDFGDDLRKTNDFQKNGFFVRFTGKV